MRFLTLIAVSLFVSAPAFAESAESGGNWGQIAFHAINLGLVIFLIVKMTRAKVKVALEQQADAVTADIDAASALHAEASKMLDDYGVKISSLDAEIAELKEQYRSQGQAEHDRLIVQAKAEAEQIRADAKRAAESEFAQVSARLEAEVVDRAIVAAETVIRAQITPGDQRRLTAEYLSRLEETTHI